MPRSPMPAIRANSKASYAVSIVAALIVARGIELLIRAASMPLETVSVRLINALLVRGWRNVVVLHEAPYSLALVGSTALPGFVLLVAGLLAGNYIASRERRGA
jgi:hypothetical protein